MANSSRRTRTSASVGFARRMIGTVLGPDLRGAGQSLIALALLAVATVVAGLALGESSERLEELPGLLLLVPAAIALRGNIFGALGSRLGTAIHAGTFRPSLRITSVVGQNVWASVVLTLVLSAVLAALAKATAVAFGVADSISLADFVVISVVGGALASALVLIIALALASGSVRYGWDPDNVTAPLVTAAGDVATLPSLIIAAQLVDSREVSVALAVVLVAIAAASAVAAFVSGVDGIQVIIRESVPVLVVALLLDLFAGVVVEKQLDELTRLPALLVLLPGFLAAAGALGGILSSRLASKLHLGLIGASTVPDRIARSDIGGTFGLALPVFVLTAMISQVGADAFDLASPGWAEMIGVALAGGFVVTVIVVGVAYYGTIVAVRFGVDPDTYGIPLVTSVLDLVGAFTFVLAIESVVFR